MAKIYGRRFPNESYKVENQRESPLYNGSFGDLIFRTVQDRPENEDQIRGMK